MERGVNIANLVQSPQDFEWPHIPRTQLLAGQVKGQVLGREPDPGPPVRKPGPHRGDGLRWLSCAARPAGGEHELLPMSPPRA